MALLSPMANEVGLKLLLCPLGSNVVVRTACCSVGIVAPVYNTFKAIEKNDPREQRKWLIYWAAFGSFSLVEVFTDKFISWCPFYYHAKFAFLVWLQLPTSEGASHMYRKFLRPFLLKHEAKCDQAIGAAYTEMIKFTNANGKEIRFVGSFIMKALSSVYQVVRGILSPDDQPPRRRTRRNIDNPQVLHPPHDDDDDDDDGDGDGDGDGNGNADADADADADAHE